MLKTSIFIKYKIKLRTHVFQKHSKKKKEEKEEEGQMKIKKSNNISIFMTKGDANSGSEDKAWAVKQYDLSKSHPNHTTLANTFQPLQFSKFTS